METFPGTSHCFEVDGQKFTIYAACGHVNRGEDFHQLCRNCQALTRKRLCCTTMSSLCEEGAARARANKDEFVR